MQKKTHKRTRQTSRNGLSAVFFSRYVPDAVPDGNAEENA
nr:MAG TPA: hypothetical protein [Caudoviricetes sp.]